MVLTVIEQKFVLGKDFKMYGSVENPLFLAKDVAEWIGYDSSSINKMINNVDEDEKLNGTIFRAGQSREMIFLTEDGLYEVLMQSRKPIAKLFKKEVKKILKSIRQNGFYAPTTLKEALILALQQQEQIEELALQNKNKDLKLEIQAPKVEYHDKVLNAHKLLTTTNIAKDLGISARKLNEELHNLDVIYKQSNVWLLYARYQHMIPEYADYHITEYGQQLKWTEKGRQWIIKLLDF